MNVNGWPTYLKFQPAEYGARTLQTGDRRQTGGRTIAYSEREREFTFANKTDNSISNTTRVTTCILSFIH